MPRRGEARSEIRLTEARSRAANSNSAIPMLETLPKRFESRIPRRRCKRPRRGKPFVVATPLRSRSLHIWVHLTIAWCCGFAGKYMSGVDVLVRRSIEERKAKSFRQPQFTYESVGRVYGSRTRVPALRGLMSSLVYVLPLRDCCYFAGMPGPDRGRALSR